MAGPKSASNLVLSDFISESEIYIFIRLSRVVKKRPFEKRFFRFFCSDIFWLGLTRARWEFKFFIIVCPRVARGRKAVLLSRLKKNMTSRREYMRHPILLVQEAGIMIYARSSDLKIADLKRPDKPSTCHWYRSKHERSVRQPVFCLSMNYSMMSRIIHGVQDRRPGLNGGSPNEFNGIPIMRYCPSNQPEFLRNLYQLIATLIWLEYAKIQLLRPLLSIVFKLLYLLKLSRFQIMSLRPLWHLMAIIIKPQLKLLIWLIQIILSSLYV